MGTEIKTPVLIVGGGPIGLSMAIELGWRGIESILVDEGDGTIEHPRTGLIAVRTMELFRRWGLAQRVRDGRWRGCRGAGSCSSGAWRWPPWP